MALYTIADLHLSFGSEKPMDVFGGNWSGYVEKIEQNLGALLEPGDTLVLGGDFSWSIGGGLAGFPISRPVSRPKDPAQGQSRFVVGDGEQNARFFAKKPTAGYRVPPQQLLYLRGYRPVRHPWMVI